MAKQQNDESGKLYRNFSHLNLQTRKILLEEINSGSNQKQIAEKLNCNKTTVSRELLRNRIKRHNKRGHFCNKCECAYVKACNIHNLCTGKDCIEPCKQCYQNKNCADLCSNFKLFECKRHTRFPYVCNGCKDKKYCVIPVWYYYDPVEADKLSRKILVSSRQGIDMTPEDFAKLDQALIHGTKFGQSVEHIVTTEDFGVTSRTIRNYINNGITTTQHEEMPRGVSFKPRVKKISKTSLAEMKRAKEGRGYADFLRYANETPFLFYSQIDTVEGRVREGDFSRLLTIIRPRSRLFICFKIEDGKQQSINAVFDRLYEQLGHDDFTFMFGTLLTDNGSEFADPLAIECSPNGEIRCHLFYCHPYSFWEKGAIEVCHELLRRIIPKGSNLKNITEEDAQKINCHINSYTRKEDDSDSAYSTFCNAFGERGKRILHRLHIFYVNSKEVLLKPELVSHND